MGGKKNFYERWKTDGDLRSLVAALGSLAVTVAFALYNGFIGVFHSSVWHGAICVYYIILSILRAFIIFAEKKRYAFNGGVRQRGKYIAASTMLVVLNLSLVVPVSIMVIQQKPVDLSLIAAITVAAYTTFKVVTASINLKRRKRSNDEFIRLLKTIGFIDALVSVLSLQNTLIMVNSGGEKMLVLAAITSAIILAASVVLSVGVLVNGIKNVR